MFPDMTHPILMGVMVGASAHRAGLCTVKAVAELMTTGRAHVLWSFLKASLWTLGFLSVASLFGAAPELAARPLSAMSLAGGMVFGIGAALNGACSISTMSRLAEGHASMLMTLAGWGIGLLVMQGAGLGPREPSVGSGLSPWLLVPGLAFMVWEGTRLVLRLRRNWRGLFVDGYWPLSLGVLVLAAANAGLLLVDRPWSFTSTAICSAEAVPLEACANPVSLWPVSGAALTAMIVSARLRGHFRLRPVRIRSALRRLMAGSLMGMGAAVIPGGNDGLILFGIPALSPHALPAWIGIVAGIWLALALMRGLGARVPTIRCENDVCRAGM